MALFVTLAGCGVTTNPFSVETPAPAGSQLPHLALDSRGGLVLSWVEQRQEAHALAYAVLDEDSGWRDPVTVAQGSDWFVNWADIPSVQPLGDNLWAAHWLVQQPGGMYAYDVAVALSRDAGRTWAAPFRPHHDSTPTEHGFVSLWPARLPDGSAAAGVLWLDGRHNLLDASRTSSTAPRTALRSAVFTADGESVEALEVDARVCDCCQPDTASAPTGLLTAYRDRSDAEIRDISVAQRGGTGWLSLGSVAADHWSIEGCPVNGPAIAANADTVAVAWYTEAGGAKRVQLTRRPLPEGRWQPPAVLDRAAPLGRVDLVLLDGGDAAVSWMAESGGGKAAIRLARVSSDGTVGKPLQIAATDASRPAGFPRIIRDDDEIVMAWTRWQDATPRVVVARVPLEELP